jgi:glutamate 5-kinase
LKTIFLKIKFTEVVLLADLRQSLKNSKCIVIKIGSSTLAHSNGRLNIQRFEKITAQIANLYNMGIKIIFVTSGAIGAGMGRLNMKSRPKTIPEKQAAAAVGQGILLHMYEKMFAEFGITVAQILLTAEDTNNRKRYINARNALYALLDMGVVPIINENDAVAVDEIKIGDNDTLSAIVASVVDADLLILLSDIEGLYDDNPSANPNAKLIDFVPYITEDIAKAAGGSGTNLGTGGMVTKIRAAEIAVTSGTAMVIAMGSKDGILNDIIEGKNVGTLFAPKPDALNAKKHWIAYGLGVEGNLIIDNGAKEAILKRGKSLLPGGIVKVEGSFDEGDIVSVSSIDGVEIARGVSYYSSKDIDTIKGFKSSDIERLLGYKNFDDVIHRDNLVVL